MHGHGLNAVLTYEDEEDEVTLTLETRVPLPAVAEIEKRFNALRGKK